MQLASQIPIVLLGAMLWHPAPIFAEEEVAARAPLPEDLLDDEHFREEIGINDFNTPSIRKIFDQLAELGPIPWDSLYRKPTPPEAGDRVSVALNLGTLIADGFMLVQCERFAEMEVLGKAILEYTELLGTGNHLKTHSKAILEQAARQNRERLKEELAKTQRDVEREMVDLRDVDIAHLISLGGWLRAFQIGCVTVGEQFDSANVARLARVDITSYYLSQLEGLHPRLQERPVISGMRRGLARLQDMIDHPAEKEFTPEELNAMRAQASSLLELIATGSN